MQTRTVAAPLLASFLMGLVAVFSGSSAARGGDECLSGPKGPTPAGGHWYYRVDRATHRNCWYLKDESVGGTKPDDAPTPDASGAAAEAAPSADVAIPPASANAHAELAAPRPERMRGKDAAATAKAEAARPAAAKADSAKADASKPQAANAEAGVDVAVGAGDPSLLVKVSDAQTMPVDGAAPPAAAPNAASNAASPNASPAADAPRDSATVEPAAATPAPVARGEASIGPLRMLLGLALMGAGVSIMLACLIFHLLYGTVTWPEQGEAARLYDLL